MPVPPEMLEESGLPQRNIDRGLEDAYGDTETEKASQKTSGSSQSDETVGDLKPRLIGGDQERGSELKPQIQGGDAFTQGKALKPKLIGIGEEEAGEALKPKLIGGEEQTGGGSKVRAVLKDSFADSGEGNSEKLVFCPNCGMHMQHDPVKCEICGMPLGNKPNNVPAASSGVPLFNTDSDPFADPLGAGGLGGFDSFNGISDEDASRIDNFVNGNSDPMFNSGSSAFNVQATPDDFAQLTEQLANFSAAAGMTSIEVAENTRIRQKEPEKGQEREVSDFLMSDDLSSESIPMSDEGVPVFGSYSMEEDPSADVVLDPYAFLNTSMDEEIQVPSKLDEQPINNGFSGLSEAVPVNQPTEIVPSIDNSRFDPISPFVSETAPYIAEETTSKTAPALSVKAENSEPIMDKTNPTGVESTAENHSVPDTFAAPRLRQIEEALTPQMQPIQPIPPVQSAQQPQTAYHTEQASPVQPAEEASKLAESTKKCYACGRKMPAADKFCPNCGRSMYGMPNPNLMNRAPAPPPAKKKPIALIVVLIVIVVAAVAAFIMLKGNAAEVYLNELSQTISDTENTFTENFAEYFIS